MPSESDALSTPPPPITQSASPFCWSVPVRWSDMTSRGYVNSATFALYPEEAVAEWRRQHSATRTLLAKWQSIEFHRPLTRLGNVKVEVEVRKAEARSSNIHLSFRVCDRAEIYATGDAIFAEIDPTGGDPLDR